MTPDQLTVSSFTSEPDNLTELFNNTALPGLHDSRRTQGGFLVAGALLRGFIPTPINSNRPLTSWVWKQGEAISKKDEKGYVVNYWLCRECFESKLQHPQKHWLKAAAPTSTPQRHLIKYHNFDENGVKTAPRGQKRAHNDIRDLMDDQEQATKRVFDRAGWQDAYTEWVAVSGTSLRGATSPALKRLLTFQHPRVEKLIPTSHTTVAAWLNEAYARHQATVVASLAKSTSAITISFDSWKANNDVLDLLGVVAHYLDEYHELRTVVLGLRDHHGSHTGANIGEHLNQVLGDFKIRSKVAYFAADNASNNDTALDYLATKVIHYQPKLMRLRCAGHVLNLVCKAILYGVDEDCVTETLHSLEVGTHSFATVSNFENTLRIADEQAKLVAWRKKGPVGKLHNLILHIKSNNSRRELFEAKQRELLPHAERVYRAVINGGIRWNSTYDMVKRSMLLKDSLMLYQEHYQAKGEINSKDALTYDDWQELTHVQALLEPIHDCSLNVQSKSTTGSHGALHEVLTTMDYLLGHLESTKEKLKDPKLVSHFKASVNLGWKKLDHYYSLSDQTPAYVLAIFLHPHYRFKWFEQKWKQRRGWLDAATKTIHDAYASAKVQHCDDLPIRPSPPHRELSAFDAYNLIEDDDEDLDADELQQYWHEKRAPQGTEPLLWWRNNHQRYPILRHLAFAVLAAPASTAASERLFSMAGNVVNEERPHMQQELAQSMQCLRSWYTEGLISNSR